MRLKLTANMILYMVIGVVIALVTLYRFQSDADVDSAMKREQEKLIAIEEKLDSNEVEIARLKDNVSENCLAKARALAEMIALYPDKKEDSKWLEQICKDLAVKELHVIDADGIITHSTVKEYIGFDMNSGEQSAAFMEIVKDPTIELAQEPQVNAAEGVVVQYAGVARRDAEGLVQIGVQPEVLTEALEGTDIATVLKEFELSEGLNKMTNSIRNASSQMLEASDSLGTATRTALDSMDDIQLAVKDIAKNANQQAGDMSIATQNVTVIGDRISRTSVMASNMSTRADVMSQSSATEYY